MLGKDSETRTGLRDYWQILLRRKWLIILPIIIIPAIAIPGSFFMKPVYEAKTSLLSQELSRSSFMSSAANINLPRGEELNTIRYKIQSVTYMKEVADKVDLANYLKSMGKPSKLEDQIIYLRNIIKLSSLGSIIIEISVQHENAKMAKDIANAVANVYIDRTMLQRQESATDTSSFINQELETYRVKLNEAEEALVKYQEKGVMESLTSENNILVNEVAKLRSNLVEVELDLQETNNELQNAKRLSTSGDSNSSYSVLYIVDPEVTKLQSKMNDLQHEYEQLSMRYTDNYPPLRKLKQEIDQTKEDIDLARKKLSIRQQNAEEQAKYWGDRLRTLQLRRLALNEKISEYDQKLQQLPQQQLEIARLEREKAAAENTYSMLLQRLNDSDLLKSSEINNMGKVAEVLDEAIEPNKPIKPNRKKIAVLAVAMGVMLGGGTTFLLEYFDRSFHSIDEVVSYLNIPVIATIPKLVAKKSDRKFFWRKILVIAIIAVMSLVVLLIFVKLITS